MMDSIDRKILAILMHEGRMTWAELAGKLRLSAPSAAERVKRLEERQVIRGYAATVDPSALGCELLAFVAVSLEKPKHRAAFIDRVARIPEIQECHHIAGDDDYLLKVRCKNTRDLDQIVSEQVKGVPGIARTRTTIVMDSLKETHVVPIKLAEPSEGGMK
jgi:Lrp/AsnC family transcriptional regulator, leucine-responsive regulatory protein